MADAKVNLVNFAGNEIIWREGKAQEPLPLKEPVKINITGDIHTVSNFIQIRKDEAAGNQVLDPAKIIVTVNKAERSITMQLDPENFYGSTITGVLEKSDELEAFHINEAQTFSRESLLKLVRFSRLYFDDKDIHARVVANLSKITLKSETEMQAANDRQGNKKASIEQKVNMPDGWISQFYLSIPIFKGFLNEKIRVDICLDVTATGFLFWLESPELVETTERQIDKIIAEQIEYCKDYVVVNK